MAEVTYTNQRGINAPLHVFLHANGLINSLSDGEFIVQYNAAGQPSGYRQSYGSLTSYLFILGGDGFIYNGGNEPTAGTVTSLTIKDASGNVVAEATGLNANLTAFYAAMVNPELALAGLFAGQMVTQTGAAGIDHLMDYGSGGSFDGKEGDDVLIGRSSNLTLIGGSGSDYFYIEGTSALTNVTVLGGKAEGVSGTDDDDVLDIRQDVSFAKLSHIDRLEFTGGQDVRVAIGTSMIGSQGLPADLALQTRRPGTVATIAIHRSEAASINLDLSGWVVAIAPGGALKTDIDLTAADTGQADYVNGSATHDAISTGAGDDTIIGNNGNDTMNGGAGNDSLFSGSSPRAGSPEIINGGEGTDFASITRWSQTKAFDFTVTPSGNQTLSDGTIIISVERVDFMGGSSDDKLTGGDFADTLEGYLGSDTLNGGGGDDQLYGGGGVDLLTGGTGNDTFLIRDAGDTIVEVAGQGTDTVLTTLDFSLAALGAVENLKAEKAEDAVALSLTGNALANTLVGNAGKNILKGSAGTDRLEGLLGDDLLYGGTGKDFLTGGAGKDAFVFDTRLNKTNIDTIIDFSAKDDTIRLENAIFKGLKKTGALSKAAFALGTKAKDASDRILYDKKTGTVLYDADGTGKSAAVKIIKIADKVALTHADFLVI